MKKETTQKLSKFNLFLKSKIFVSEKYGEFEGYINQTISGEGLIGDNNYLILWDKSEIEDLNDTYETQEFLNNIILIGSDGGDVAYGIDIKGQFIEVPFIGMDNSEVKIIAKNFDGFINYVYKK